MEKKDNQDGRTASYLVNSFADLKDVVLTIEQMITNTTDVRNKAVLREGCRISVVPIKDRGGVILRIKLHESMMP